MGLPAELWIKHIIPWCSRRWFEARKLDRFFLARDCKLPRGSRLATGLLPCSPSRQRQDSLRHSRERPCVYLRGAFISFSLEELQGRPTRTWSTAFQFIPLGTGLERTVKKGQRLTKQETVPRKGAAATRARRDFLRSDDSASTRAPSSQSPPRKRHRSH